MILRLATANENHWKREGTTLVVPQERRTFKRLQPLRDIHRL